MNTVSPARPWLSRARFAAYARLLLLWNPLVAAVITGLTAGFSDFFHYFWISLILATPPAVIGVLSGLVVEIIESVVYARRGLPRPKHGAIWFATVAACSMPLGVFVGQQLGVRLFDLELAGWSDILQGMFIGALVLGVFVLAQSASDMRDARRAAELTLARSENERLKASVSALTAQMSPHFLFNALNAVASLVKSAPDRAEDVVLDLADLYRGVLQATKVHTHPLADELALAKSYLAIERTRFDGRLEARFDVDIGLEAIEVAPLVLQPLVENAVKHGTSRRAGGGKVSVRVAREGETIRLEVHDDGAGYDAESSAPGTGTGLANIRARLALVYGDRASLDVAADPAGGTLATVRIPMSP